MEVFSNKIYNWYTINKRNLPWRNTNNAYKIWISEIILQQTRVAQGTNYYLRFIENFPNVEELARADEDEVLKLWQGLGYYSRARNLHHTAKIIVKSFNSQFPEDYKSIIKLKGIGPYTAAAITSIAFNKPYPTVDGNIYRILSRYFGIKTAIDSSAGKKQFQELAEELINNQAPGMHNQALMEFGALQCIPKSPNCPECPLNEWCYALQNNFVHLLPIKEKKTKQRKRFFYYYLIDDGAHIYLEKRQSDDIWKNLYQLPLSEFDKEKADDELVLVQNPFVQNGSVNIKHITPQKKHVLSHQIIYAKVLYLEVANNINISSSLIRVNKKDIYKFAVPRLVEHFLEELNLLEKTNN